MTASLTETELQEMESEPKSVNASRLIAEVRRLRAAFELHRASVGRSFESDLESYRQMYEQENEVDVAFARRAALEEAVGALGSVFVPYPTTDGHSRFDGDSFDQGADAAFKKAEEIIRSLITPTTEGE